MIMLLTTGSGTQIVTLTLALSTSRMMRRLLVMPVTTGERIIPMRSIASTTSMKMSRVRTPLELNAEKIVSLTSA